MDEFTREELLRLSWDKPILAQIEITNRCNQECSFCYQARTLESPELSASDWLLILSKLVGIGVRRIDFTGSESFMSPYLLDLCAWCKSEGLEVRVNTNGTINVSRCLPYVDELVFSVHGLGKMHDDIVRLSGAFQRVVDNIQIAVLAGKRVSINMTLLETNFDSILEVYNYFSSQYTIHKFSPIIPTPSLTGRLFGGNSLAINSTILKQYITILKQIRPEHLLLKHGMHSIYISDPLYYSQSHFPLPNCAAGKYKIVVDHDGSVYPCNFFKSSDYYCGNILEEDAGKIWREGEGFGHFRDLIIKEDVPEQCESCLKIKKCFSGCRAWSEKFNNGGLGNAKDRRCEMGSAFIRG